MASVTRRDRSPYWTACYTDRDGRQLKRSTKTGDRAAAMRIALDLESVEKRAKAGSITITQMRKVLNDVSEKVNGEGLNVPSTEDYLNGWLANVEAKNKPATHGRYKNAVEWFLEHLQGKAKRAVTQVTPQDVEDFLARRLKIGMAPMTAVFDVKILKMAFQRAENYGTILKNPCSAVQLPKAESSEREVFTHEEVQRLVAAAPSLDWQTLILLGYFLGARLGDCAMLKWENVSIDEGVIVYRQQKTGKRVVVPMHFQILKHLEYKATFGTEGYICPKLAERGTGGKQGLSQAFQRIAAKAQVDLMVVQGKGRRKFSQRSFHSLRHTFNSVMANAGVSDEIRMKLTGHQTRPMNDRYTHLQVGTLKQAMDKMPLFGEGVRTNGQPGA